MTRLAKLVPRAVALMTLAAAAACTVAESDHISLDPSVMAYSPKPCTSALGSYALPKAFLHIRVGQGDLATAPQIMPAANSKPVEVLRHADNALVFCLDHLSSVFADEKITIAKWPLDKTDADKGSLLGAVMVNVTDQTAFIVRALLRTLFIAVTGAPDFSLRSTPLAPDQVVADLEIDPFDQREMAVANARLTKLGYCLVLQDFGFPSDVSIEQYCSAPLVHGYRLTPIYKAYAQAEATAIDPRRPGILYRPRIPYRLMIFQKRDPRGREPWLLSQMMNVELENLSPVLSLRVERGLFSGKNINFIFEEGTLKHACISKTSELEGFVTIPLEIAKSIVAVPASIVAVRIDQIGSKKKLLAAETQLYQVQQAYLVKLAGETATLPSNLPTQQNVVTRPPEFFSTVPSDITRTDPAPPFGNTLQVCNPAGLT